MAPSATEPSPTEAAGSMATGDLQWPLGEISPPFRAELRVRMSDPAAAGRLAAAVTGWLQGLGREHIVVVCIGTDRSTGDALGPLVGTLLARSTAGRGTPATVLGTLDHPVHAGNLQETLVELEKQGAGSTVIAVDACLGRRENVGSISAGRGPLQPGAGVHKALPLVGDLFVTGTVNVGGFMEYFVLQNTRLSIVMRMAEVIAAGLAGAIDAFSSARQAAAGCGPVDAGRPGCLQDRASRGTPEGPPAG